MAIGQQNSSYVDETIDVMYVMRYMTPRQLSPLCRNK